MTRQTRGIADGVGRPHRFRPSFAATASGDDEHDARGDDRESNEERADARCAMHGMLDGVSFRQPKLLEPRLVQRSVGRRRAGLSGVTQHSPIDSVAQLGVAVGRHAGQCA
jgi:hypothetical protein